MTHESAFRSAAREVLTSKPGPVCLWDQCTWQPAHPGCLRISALDADGFDVELHEDAEEITIYTGRGGAHFHASLETDADIRKAVALVRDLLGPSSRLRVSVGGGLTSRWSLEFFDGLAWSEPRHRGGVLGLNLWPVRTERVLQNRHVPADVSRVASLETEAEAAAAVPSLRDVLRADAVVLFVFGTVHLVLDGLGRAWGGALLGLGALNLLVPVRLMFLVNGFAAFGAGGLTFGSSSIGWKIFGVVQFSWGLFALVKFLTGEGDG